MNYEREKKVNVSFCGSYCHTCDWHTGRIKRGFRRALDDLETFGFRKWLGEKVDVENFKRGLDLLANTTICSGCKQEIEENPEDDRCPIRQCCARRGLDLCNECTEFPCETLTSNPGVVRFGCIENLKEIREKGFEAWVDEQWEEISRGKRSS